MSYSFKVITKSEKETKEVAEDFAKKILKKSIQDNNAIIVGLIGDLGAGKTTFAQGFAKGLGIRQKIASPTFVILKNYKTQTTRHKLIHIDAYRLENEKELLFTSKLSFS